MQPWPYTSYREFMSKITCEFLPAPAPAARSCIPRRRRQRIVGGCRDVLHQVQHGIAVLRLVNARVERQRIAGLAVLAGNSRSGDDSIFVVGLADILLQLPVFRGILLAPYLLGRLADRPASIIDRCRRSGQEVLRSAGYLGPRSHQSPSPWEGYARRPFELRCNPHSAFIAS